MTLHAGAKSISKHLNQFIKPLTVYFLIFKVYKYEIPSVCYSITSKLKVVITEIDIQITLALIELK